MENSLFNLEMRLSFAHGSVLDSLAPSDTARCSPVFSASPVQGSLIVSATGLASAFRKCRAERKAVGSDMGRQQLRIPMPLQREPDAVPSEACRSGMSRLTSGCVVCKSFIHMSNSTGPRTEP